MKTICNTLQVSRSNITDRSQGKRNKRGPYQKTEDKELLPTIRSIVDERPTYGYRRVHAVLNRRRRSQRLPPVNHKRVYRIMKRYNLLLQRYPVNRTAGLTQARLLPLKAIFAGVPMYLRLAAGIRKLFELSSVWIVVIGKC